MFCYRPRIIPWQAALHYGNPSLKHSSASGGIAPLVWQAAAIARGDISGHGRGSGMCVVCCLQLANIHAIVPIVLPLNPTREDLSDVYICAYLIFSPPLARHRHPMLRRLHANRKF